MKHRIRTMLAVMAVAAMPAVGSAQWLNVDPFLYTDATSPYVGFGTAIPQDRIHLYSFSATVLPRSVIRLSHGRLIQTTGDTSIASSQIAMEPEGGAKIFSDIATLGDMVIRTKDLAADSTMGTDAEDIIISTQTNSGYIRLATTPAIPGPDIERVTVMPTGNVGISNTGPGATLHVGTSDANGRMNMGTQEYIRDAGPSHIILGLGHVTSSHDCTYDLGSTALRWRYVITCNGVINTSDARRKDNIENLSYGLAEVLQLRPVSFTWKDKAEEGRKLGVIAQEVQKVLPEVVKDPSTELRYDEQGNLLPNDADAPLGVFYADMIPVLIKAIQEQQAVIEQSKADIDNLHQRVAALEARLAAAPAEQTAAVQQYADILLEQNSPNPFSESTTIMYYIPADVVGRVELVVADASGSTVLQRHPAVVNTPQQVTVSARGLETGVYVYGVAVDGRMVVSKKMMIVK